MLLAGYITVEPDDTDAVNVGPITVGAEGVLPRILMALSGMFICVCIGKFSPFMNISLP